MTVNGKSAKCSYEPAGGDLVELRVPPPEPTDVIPQDLPLNIIYEDHHLIALNKQIGIICHPSHPAQLGTRYAAVYAHYLENLSAARERYARFAEGQAKAVAAGTVFDDAATVRGLTNFFRQGRACGALRAEDVPAGAA